MPGVSGPFEEHDLLVRPRDLPDVRRPDVGMSHLPENCRKKDPSLLVDLTASEAISKRVGFAKTVHKS